MHKILCSGYFSVVMIKTTKTIYKRKGYFDFRSQWDNSPWWQSRGSMQQTRWLEQKLRAYILYCKHEGRESKLEIQVFKLSKLSSSEYTSGSKATPLKPPKQRHQLETKCSNVQHHGGQLV